MNAPIRPRMLDGRSVEPDPDRYWISPAVAEAAAGVIQRLVLDPDRLSADEVILVARHLRLLPGFLP